MFCYGPPMLFFPIKALPSGAVVATVSAVARRYPGFGGLIASLPLVSILGMVWLWRDTHDRSRMAAHASGAFWFVLPSLPLFLLIPSLLRRGVPLWAALGSGCLLIAALYLATVYRGPRFGLRP